MLLSNPKSYVLYFVSLILLFSLCVYLTPNAILDTVDEAELLSICCQLESGEWIVWFGHLDQEGYEKNGMKKWNHFTASSATELLHCIADGKERRTFQTEDAQYSLRDLKIVLRVRTEKASSVIKEIILGKENYTVTKQFGIKKEILHPEQIEEYIIENLESWL